MANEFGDYQTPQSLAEKVVKLVKRDKVIYKNVIEPTFGKGTFLKVVLSDLKGIEAINGYELNRDYYNDAIKIVDSYDVYINLICGNIFAGNLQTFFNEKTTNLVIGNLPWVTSAKLSSLESKNVPTKNNIKGLSGFDALTGKSNFDVSEFITLKLLTIMSGLRKRATFAMLMKNSVSQRLARYIPNSNINPTSFRIYRFDAKKEFNANTDAGLLMIGFNEENNTFNNLVDVYNLDDPSHLQKTYGWVNTKFVSNVKQYTENAIYDNSSNWEWRSGIKHDASKVLELKLDDDSCLENNLDEKINIEDKYVYPLVKSSLIRKQRVHRNISRFIIVTQRKIGENTEHIKTDAPLTWQYLSNHKDYFEKRKSSIYLKSADYAIFGVGDYSFKLYKVAVSAMYKKPVFAILPPYHGKAVMVDDTVNFVGFDTYEDAIIFSAVMNSRRAQELLEALTFNQSKRPYTIGVLKRIDAISILKDMSVSEVNSSTVKTVDASRINNFVQKYSSESISLF